MITVYSKPHCPYCDKAKHYLKTNDIPFEVVDISESPEAREFIVSAGHRTVPQLYIGKDLLVEGGYTGLEKMGAEAVKQKLLG